MNFKSVIVSTIAVSGASACVTGLKAAEQSKVQHKGVEVRETADQVFRSFLEKLDPFEFQRSNHESRGHSFSN